MWRLDNRGGIEMSSNRIEQNQGAQPFNQQGILNHIGLNIVLGILRT